MEYAGNLGGKSSRAGGLGECAGSVGAGGCMGVFYGEGLSIGEIEEGMRMSDGSVLNAFALTGHLVHIIALTYIVQMMGWVFCTHSALS